MNHLFDNIVCLNLESRPERKKQSEHEFACHGIKAEFFKATPGGYIGFNKSMYNIFQSYSGSLMVFEDDVEFIESVVNVEDAFNELPEDWDLLYLGANLREPVKRYSNHLMILKNAWTTHAVGYSAKMVTWLKDNWNGDYSPPFVFDEWLRQKVQPDFKCFITDPMVCTQRGSYSDIQKRVTNYKVHKTQSLYEQA